MTKVARRGRNQHRAQRLHKEIKMLPGLTHNLPLTEPMDEAQIEKIDLASKSILENVGIEFRDPVALSQWKEKGAKVEGERVYIDRGLLTELISTLPETFTLHARDPKKNIPLGKNRSLFVPMTGAPFIRDLEDQRRWPTLDDLAIFHKLVHQSEALHSTAHHIVEPMDCPVSHRHLHITNSSISYSDKTFMGMTSSGKNAEDVMAMCKIVFGQDYLETHPVVTGNINANSPLVWDETMLVALRVFSANNQPVLCSPFVLGGANTPASVPATVAQLNAEALSGLAYTQLVRAGAPAIYGHYLSTVSMKSGAPMAGTPEIALMNFMIGQMARYYKIPWRTSNTLGGAKVFDAQAGYESAFNMMAVMMSGANYIWHSAGWNEAGMHCSIAKFVVDAEQCAMAYKMASGIDWSDFDQAVSAINDIGPGGHFLGHPHTLERFQDAFFMPQLFDNNSIEQWQADGSHDTTKRALTFAKKQLDEYQQPELDVTIREALDAFINKRQSEIPAADALNHDI